ncbi:tubulin binding cofactor A [Yarrowia lipolytica]|uniref:Tubulin-specific chaperone A n=1 Tax=Yarrowia lipolytica TaxID=4952 RepID=A0A371C7C5_YARLL|nr:tubulin binding cofactor A [Yarrowia lipolytica]KAE8171822.1 tubulin binding cofactor A [Yarrowia lipolytica]QNP97974.1 Tubulin-specific chaperone A [Yarrowia lipolytica]RDW26217.1 tubulin binding cofactor A [Yarrowia lipolytica]RDW32968.1 tubulin binding cofactor A [Yarrowia lipolytica]
MPSQIKIKTSALGRLIKEEKLYKQETAEQAARVEKMKANGEDEYDIKKQIEVLKDTEQMVPVMRKKIDEMKASLEGILGSEDADPTEVQDAKKQIELALSA